jgi:hypothetical protein
MATLPALDPVVDLCRKYLALESVLEDISNRRNAEHDEAAARFLLTEWERVAARQDRLMGEIVRIPATSYGGIAAKVEVWLAAHGYYDDHDLWLIEAVLADLRAMGGR